MRICLRSFVTGFWNSSPSCSSSVSRHATSPRNMPSDFPSHTSHLCSSLSGKEPQSQPSVPVWLTSQLACVEPTRLQAWLRRMTASLLKIRTSWTQCKRTGSYCNSSLPTLSVITARWARASALCFWALSYPCNGDAGQRGWGGLPWAHGHHGHSSQCRQGAGHLQLHRAAIDWLTRW